MAAIVQTLQNPIPKPLLCIGTPIAAAALIVLFVFLRFPYNQLEPSLSHALSQATGSQVQILDIEPDLTWAGPGMAALGVQLIRPGQPRIEIDQLRIRPAWSTRWLSLEPTFKVDLESSLGSADGILALGPSPGWTGRFETPDLSLLPLPPQTSIELTGALTAEADLRLEGSRPGGPVRFEAVSGSLSHPEIPIPVEFDQLNGQLTFGGKNLVEIDEIILDGPVIAADVVGSIIETPGGSEPRLDIDVIIEVKSAPLKAMMRGMGLRLDRNGRTSFKLGGTPSRPNTL